MRGMKTMLARIAATAALAALLLAGCGSERRRSEPEARRRDDRDARPRRPGPRPAASRAGPR